MAIGNFLHFIREVRVETSRVTWPGKQEVLVTTVMVLIMVALTALFFLVVDTALKWLVDTFIYRV